MMKLVPMELSLLIKFSTLVYFMIFCVSSFEIYPECTVQKEYMISESETRLKVDFYYDDNPVANYFLQIYWEKSLLHMFSIHFEGFEYYIYAGNRSENDSLNANYGWNSFEMNIGRKEISINNSIHEIRGPTSLAYQRSNSSGKLRIQSNLNYTVNCNSGYKFAIISSIDWISIPLIFWNNVIEIRVYSQEDFSLRAHAPKGPASMGSDYYYICLKNSSSSIYTVLRLSPPYRSALCKLKKDIDYNLKISLEEVIVDSRELENFSNSLFVPLPLNYFSMKSMTSSVNVSFLSSNQTMNTESTCLTPLTVNVSMSVALVFFIIAAFGFGFYSMVLRKRLRIRAMNEEINKTCNRTSMYSTGYDNEICATDERCIPSCNFEDPNYRELD